MAKRTSPVKEEECSVAAAAGGIQDGEIGKDDDGLKYARAEAEEAREENERLKKVLTRTVKDYEALQMHFFDVMDVQQAPAARSTPRERRRADDNFEELAELVSLRLGTSAINAEVHGKKDNRKRSKEEEDDIGGLTLGLGYRKFGSSSHSAMIKRPPPSLSSDEEPKEEEAVEPWPPSAKNSRSEDEEVVKPLQAHIVKRARISVRARCDAPTMNDGCQWRKYGQKVSKGNPCPRAYYRCTCAPMCPVRKQVQRCAEDMSILITTYEGSHNHPLPISATAIASTTSAAACMLTSGSSAPRLSGTFATSSSSSTPQSAYPYNYSSISSHPTITLDLTNSKYNSSDFAPAAVPTTLNFSSSIDQSNSMPSWTSSCTSHPYSSLNQTCWQRVATSALPPPAPNNLSSTGTIARAITSDSSFQSALAAAITSYVENIANIASGNLVNVGAYGYSSYLNRSTSLLGSSRRGGSTLLPPPAPVISSGPKSASGSPVDEMEHAC